MDETAGNNGLQTANNPLTEHKSKIKPLFLIFAGIIVVILVLPLVFVAFKGDKITSSGNNTKITGKSGNSLLSVSPKKSEEIYSEELAAKSYATKYYSPTSKFEFGGQ